MFMDEGNHGATWNHLRALSWAAEQTDRVVIIEDDGIPVDGFEPHAEAWLSRHSDDLISFYLGTGHPRQWMTRVDAQWDNHSDIVLLPQLIHGVAYSIPPAMVSRVVANIDTTRPADYAIGEAWHRLTGRPTVYPKVSLVDHADIPSLVRRGDRATRRARALAGGY